jgi:hypothetical protein
MVSDLLLRHIDLQLLLKSILHVRSELVDVDAVCIVCDVTHNLIKHSVLAAQIGTQMTTAHVLMVLNK